MKLPIWALYWKFQFGSTRPCWAKPKVPFRLYLTMSSETLNSGYHVKWNPKSLSGSTQPGQMKLPIWALNSKSQFSLYTQTPNSGFTFKVQIRDLLNHVEQSFVLLFSLHVESSSKLLPTPPRRVELQVNVKWNFKILSTLMWRPTIEPALMVQPDISCRAQFIFSSLARHYM